MNKEPHTWSRKAPLTLIKISHLLSRSETWSHWLDTANTGSHTCMCHEM